MGRSRRTGDREGDLLANVGGIRPSHRHPVESEPLVVGEPEAKEPGDTGLQGKLVEAMAKIDFCGKVIVKDRRSDRVEGREIEVRRSFHKRIKHRGIDDKP